ncbi:unnamed protein product [Lactuca saligna]|uniref:ubiquitinyl hydrolase 1 n=1 Tax=Lactuca saligna TaxID=75948 RepID=A0AA36E717_LACSI|nr:unnamed protein product [Lactuca saligna]
MVDIDYDLIFGISDHAVDAELNAPDNHIPELTKLTDDSTSTPQEIDESMQNDPVEGEHLDSSTLFEGEHSFEGENERIDDVVEGEHDQNDENFQDRNDNQESMITVRFFLSMEAWESRFARVEVEEKKKPKRGKKNESGSSEKPVKETKPKKSPKKKPVTVDDPILPEVSGVVSTPIESTTVEETQEKEIIPLKTTTKTKESLKLQELNPVNESSIPKETTVIPPEVPIVKSSNEETRTSDITINVSNTYTNVNMGDEGTKPDSQVIHLKRFKYIEQLGRYQKLSYRVVFPVELKLSNTVEDTDAEYSLFAVVVHVGSRPNHGHYVSLVKSRNHWLFFDDENVEMIDASAVQTFFGSAQEYSSNTDHGYILFYERVDVEVVVLLVHPPVRHRRKLPMEFQIKVVMVFWFSDVGLL